MTLTRAEFIQRAALTLGWDAKKTQLQHIEALADAVNEVAPFKKVAKKLRWSVKKELHCSFCKEPVARVGKLIEGPNVSICSACVELCAEILHEEQVLQIPASRNSCCHGTPGCRGRGDKHACP